MPDGPVRHRRLGWIRETGAEDWPEKKILVLLDGSERAEQVLPYVIDHAKMSDAEVTLFRVHEPATIPSDYPADMPLSWEEHIERMTAHQREQCSLYLGGIERRLKDDGLKVKSECILSDNAAQEIINYAAKSRLNLIAMTTHARCALSVWPIGSTADKVIHGIDEYIMWLEKLEGDFITIKYEEEAAGTSMEGQKVVFTGFRDRDLQAAVEAAGGEMQSGVSGKTTLLVTKNPNSTSGKVQKARDKGVKIVGIDELRGML